MAAIIDGYQVFQQTEKGNWLPVSDVFGAYRDAVKERMRLYANDGGIYQVQSIINNNNSK